MPCPRCGTSAREGSATCESCGTSIAADPEQLPAADHPTATQAPSLPARPSGGPSPTTPDLEPGARLGTRYEILSVLGEGGMGKVYKAHDRELGRTVALKVIRPALASRPDLLARFKREILLASKVSHRNVLRIHDLGEAGQVKFISMHYVEGEDLKTMLRREGPLPLERALPIIRQIGEALQAAHDVGIVHRDLKPQNVLVDREGNACIGDFGISRSIETGATMTETGAIIGTVDYMSPEQARGERPDHRGDIYSLGVILYEMFTGALPFRSDDPLSVMMQRVHQDPPTIRQSRPEAPAWISAIVSRALARDTAERYQSVGDLLRDLERHRASIAWRRLLLRAVAPAVVLAAVAAAAGYYTVQRIRTAGPGAAAPARAVAFLPFENATGDPTLDSTCRIFPTLISGALQDVPAITILGGDRTHRTLGDLKLPLTGTYTAFELRRAASVLGAEIVVTGVVRGAGGSLQAEARVKRSGKQGMQEVAVVREEGQGEASVFSLGEALAGKIGRALGVRPSKGGTRRATTRSVEAFRLYAEGLDLIRGGRDLDASQRLEEAVVKDPAFALAHALLSQTYLSLGHQDRALAASDAAVKNLEGVSDHEARLIRARHAGLEGRLDRAVEEYRALLEVHPQDAEARFELARVFEKKSDLTAAAAELERCTSLDPGHVPAMALLGYIQLEQGDTAAALKVFSDLLGRHTETGNDEGKGDAFHSLGNVHFQMARFAEALGYYKQAYEIRSRIGDRVGMALSLQGFGSVYINQGLHADAIRSNREALDLLVQVGDPRRTAKAWGSLGESHYLAGQLAEARKCYQEGLKIARDLNDPAILASISGNLGRLAEALGNYSDAYVFHQQALEKRRAVGNKRQVLISLIDLTLIEQWQGRFEEALVYAAESNDIIREIGDHALAATQLINVGTIHDAQGSYSRAIRSLEEGAEGAREVESKNLIAYAQTYLGGVFVHVGHLAEAERRLDEAARLMDETDEAFLEPELLNCRAELQCARGESAACLKSLEEALRKARSLGDRRLVILTRLNLGRFSLDLGRPGGREHLSWVVDEAGASTLLPLRVRALAHLASERSGRTPGPAQAARAEQALKEGRPLNVREPLVLATRTLALAAAARNDTAEARRLFREAEEHVREMANGLEEPYRSALLRRSDIARLAHEALAHADGNAAEPGAKGP